MSVRVSSRPFHTRLLFGVAVLAAVSGSVPSPPLEAQTDTHALIVVGLGGSEAYRAQFHEQASTLATALVERLHLPVGSVTYLGEQVERDPARVAGRATRERVLAELGRLTREAGAEDRILLVMIGHGTTGTAGVSFNLPGPDLTPADLRAALDPFTTQMVALVHTGSGSGGFLAPLAGARRILITATRTDRELNATDFGEHFVEALSGGDADSDKDGRISLLEAFLYTRGEVERGYATRNEILTEHAVLDDSGDGRGSEDLGPRGEDGRLAAAFLLGGRVQPTESPTDDPEIARLRSERDGIQDEIEALRVLQGSVPEEEYLERMEELLVRLALKVRELRARGEAP